jgi:hypothetical protein
MQAEAGLKRGGFTGNSQLYNVNKSVDDCHLILVLCIGIRNCGQAVHRTECSPY